MKGKQTSELAVQDQASHQAVAGFAPTEENIELLKNTLGDVTLKDNELALFLYQAKRTGLDPLARQIYALKTGGRVTFMVSIDGQRLVAQRTGEYEGQAGPQWCGKDGIWRDVWLADEFPSAARVGVYRTNFKDAVYGVATWSSYGKNKGTWSEKPDIMLAKCAEALALRKAFPQELAGLYTDEEMPPVDNRPRMTMAQAFKQAGDKLAAGGVTSREDKLAIICGIAEVEQADQLTGTKMLEVLDIIKTEPIDSLKNLYVPTADFIEGEIANEATSLDDAELNTDIVDLAAKRAAEQPPTAAQFTVPEFKPSASGMIHPSIKKLLMEWGKYIEVATGAMTETFVQSVIGKNKPENHDEAIATLDAMAIELNARAEEAA